MDKEVAYSVHLAVAMLASAALIALIAFTVYIGNGTRVDVAEQATRLQTNLETGQLNSLADGTAVVMPKASIYYIMSKEYTGVNSVKYSVKVTSGVKSWLSYKINSKGLWSLNGAYNTGIDQWTFPYDMVASKGLEGKVRVTVTRLDSTGYEIMIDENI